MLITLSAALRFTPRLVDLQLIGNKFTDHGALVFFDALQYTPSLNWLLLAGMINVIDSIHTYEE